MTLLHLVLQSVGGEGVRTCVDAVVAPLGQIWHSAGDDDVSLLRKRVLNILTVVVGALGSAEAAGLNPLVMPMLAVATDLRRPESDYVMEDGLELWATAIMQAPEYTPELHAIFPHLPPLLARDLEFLAVAMKLVEAYVILGEAPFLDTHATSLTELFGLIVTEGEAALSLDGLPWRFESQCTPPAQLTYLHR